MLFSWMSRYAMLAVVVVATLGCTANNEPNRAADGVPTPEIVTTTTAAAETTTTTTIVLSAGLIEVGPVSYDLDFTCIAPGAGEILAIGLGVDGNGKRVEAYVQAFLGEPYVGLRIETEPEPTLFESRLEGVLDFNLENDILRFYDVDFVTELDLETGEFVPAGIGSVVVECRAYDDELPPSIFD